MGPLSEALGEEAASAAAVGPVGYTPRPELQELLPAQRDGAKTKG